MKLKVHAEVWRVSTRVGSLAPVASSLARPWLYIVSRWMGVAMVLRLMTFCLVIRMTHGIDFTLPSICSGVLDIQLISIKIHVETGAKTYSWTQEAHSGNIAGQEAGGRI